MNLQILTDRNPTSWSASGLASGLDINNSGVITGSVSSLSAFTATVTAINADGNDSKSISFGVSKGNRVITWNQTFAGLTYGDNPVSFTGTATGSGDFNYTSSDSTILEINGTTAIIRGGGTVTVTATAAENSTMFAATPVAKSITVGKAPLTITGQDLALSVGDTIPDLNWTATGWKHSDASALSSAIFSTAPTVTTDATSSSSAGTYYVRPGGAVSKKYSFSYVDGQLDPIEPDCPVDCMGAELQRCGSGPDCRLKCLGLLEPGCTVHGER